MQALIAAPSASDISTLSFGHPVHLGPLNIFLCKIQRNYNPRNCILQFKILTHILIVSLYQPTLVQAWSGVSNIAHLEIDLQQEANVSPSGQDEGDQLQELPFTPVHAPVITLGMNVPR